MKQKSHEISPADRQDVAEGVVLKAKPEIESLMGVDWFKKFEKPLALEVQRAIDRGVTDSRDLAAALMKRVNYEWKRKH